MEQSIVIVESPAKSKTIKKYLGKNFTVLASYGHVRDLIPKEGAVDPEQDFAMRYQLIEKNAKHLAEICKTVKNSTAIYLATDPDREGEAISWHICEYLREKKLLKQQPIYRIAFHQITPKAVQDAVANPRALSMDLVNAQQARRALDYLVGFNLSPLLWRKVRRGLSAGRVQSPALRLIVERELEIEAFKTQEYWTLTAQFTAHQQAFEGRLIVYQGEKLQQFSLTDEAQAQQIQQNLLHLAQGSCEVLTVEKKQRKRNPSAPFITSTLQQEAARKLGFTAQRTMRVAQQLYEGVDVGQGSVGLITYMRTDSVNLAQEAVAELRDFIAQRYGQQSVPMTPPVYKTKAKNAQEAHEAIRPTSVLHHPDTLKSSLTEEQARLYQLIWSRTVASQMIPATIDTVAVDLACGTQDNIFRATGSVITHPGFMAVYLEGLDDAKKVEDDEKMLPPLAQGDKVSLLGIQPLQHFTEPPPRYTEASLVKALEEYGIGRPSTYASIISTLQSRDYTVLENKRFYPTDVGRVVNRFLTQFFSRYVDYSFTAHLEDALDEVSRGEKEWIPLLREFWQPFKTLLNTIDHDVQRQDVTQEKLAEQCPKCQHPLSKRLGKRGLFIGCTAYPDCDYTRNIDGDTEEQPAAQIVEDRQCPDCQGALIIRSGSYGKFIGCSNYPRCKHIEPLVNSDAAQVGCPQCHQGQLVQRRTRKAKIFYSCSRYPQCDYALWDEPVNESCPQCQWPVLGIKVSKRHGKQKICPQKACGYTAAVVDEQ